MPEKKDKPDVITVVPKSVVIGILVLSVLPLLLSLVGVDFSITSTDLRGQFVPRPLEGSYIFTLLTWTGAVMAGLTVFIAFLHYGITGDVTIPIIGVALFCAGMMDAFQVLVTTGLVKDGIIIEEYIPLLWTVTRGFLAALFIVGTVIFVSTKKIRSEQKRVQGLKYVLAVSVLLGVAAFMLMHYVTGIEEVPRWTYPNQLLKHPWDLVPLLMFLMAGAFVLPINYKWDKNLFTHALIISTVPSIMGQVHMLFFSSAMYDSHFNIACFLRIVSYVTPLLGLALDYEVTYMAISKFNKKLLSESFEKKQTEETLLRERNVLGLLMTKLPILVYVKDISRRYIRMSESYASLLGVSFSALALGKGEGDFFPADTVAKSREIEDAIVKTGAPVKEEIKEITDKSGHTFKLSISRVPVKDDNGKLVGILCMGEKKDVL